MYSFIELAGSNGISSPYISAAIAAGVVDAGGYATENTLEAIEAVIELKNELEEDKASTLIPTYKAIGERLAEKGGATSSSRSTIKRAIDIVFLRKTDKEGTHPNTVNLDEFLLREGISNDVAALITEKRSSLEVVERRVNEYLLPLIEAANDGYSFTKTPRVLAMAIQFRLTEPEGSIVALQRYIFGNSNGRALSYGQAKTAADFFHQYANGSALSEIKIQRITRIICAFVRTQRRFQRMLPMDGEVVRDIAYSFTLGVYRHALEQSKYMEFDDG